MGLKMEIKIAIVIPEKPMINNTIVGCILTTIADNRVGGGAHKRPCARFRPLCIHRNECFGVRSEYFIHFCFLKRIVGATTCFDHHFPVSASLTLVKSLCFLIYDFLQSLLLDGLYPTLIFVLRTRYYLCAAQSLACSTITDSRAVLTHI